MAEWGKVGFAFICILFSHIYIGVACRFRHFILSLQIECVTDNEGTFSERICFYDTIIQ
ncbi:hypothetical protein HMPREF1991_01913 [Hoylesella loescheii DSM 19665 = JCM 12249 = ATCC 15930]|uniref:Uncharacterized protein n=1 Tax=Hoylesella loescheii DSM 19665 = JCM 12249 = ATCC 15930 TaxID=1122985 RepID=A0A069QGV6_HOYLO|nr:hypothetical protein HMPREF1991_01913 [Hoylesella loescheii DSM 19665 = JCM 12249 = ATCC 15930]